MMLMAVPGHLHGQIARDLEAEVRRLEIEVERARFVEDSLREVQEEREIARFIRLKTGGLELLTIPPLREQAEAAGHLAWTVLAATYQDSVATLLRSFPLSILPQPAAGSAAGVAWYPRGTRLVFARGDDDARGLATSILSQVIQELWLRQDQELRDWMKSPPPVTTDLSSAFVNAYIDLATSASPMAQRCLEQAGSCLEALGLSRPADPAATWYSPGSRKRLVQDLSQYFQVGEFRDAYDQCLAGSDQHCTELLRKVPDRIPSGVLPPTRLTFLRIVLENGGAGAYPLLLATTGEPLPRRLQSAAGGSLEQSVTEWHRRVLEARPVPTTIRRGQSLAAIGWTALLLVLALRSSRWR
jgi:hypothetical protein